MPSAAVEILGDRVTATIPSGDSVSVLFHGATVLSWKTADGSEQLWVSEKAVFDGSKPVRGGVPIVFPVSQSHQTAQACRSRCLGQHLIAYPYQVFGKSNSGPTASLPQHGFARISKWEFLGKNTSESFKGGKNSDSSVQLDFGLSAASISADFRKAWPFEFNLIYTVILGPSKLETSMQVQNSGTESFDFNLLFHTYFRVSDISSASVGGLTGASLKDKVAGKSAQEEEKEVNIRSEVDRVYELPAAEPLTILEGGKPKIAFERQNLPNVTVWNPWENYTKMSDFAPGYKQMSRSSIEAGLPCTRC